MYNRLNADSVALFRLSATYGRGRSSSACRLSISVLPPPLPSASAKPVRDVGSSTRIALVPTGHPSIAHAWLGARWWLLPVNLQGRSWSIYCRQQIRRHPRSEFKRAWEARRGWSPAPGCV